MQPTRHRTRILITLAALAGLASGIALGAIADSESEPQSADLAGAPPSGPQPLPAPKPGVAVDPPKAETSPPPEADPDGLVPGPSGPPPKSNAEQNVADAARGYVQALDLRHGGAVCRSFAPDALARLKFPARRRGCAATVEASLGFKHRGGLPIWEHSEMTDSISASVEGQSARVVATVFTQYADVREPSIEDDVIYLTRIGRRWLIAKPSATIHRAIGIADVPASVLTPP